MEKNIQKTFRNFIIENFLFEEDDNLKEDTSFLENGIIDSTGVLELVMFIEETYGISVEDDEIVPENLDSISKITEYVQRKQEQSTTSLTELAEAQR
jgi:acyl carrier protein